MVQNKSYNDVGYPDGNETGRERRKGMTFRFDKGLAMKPVRVSWLLAARTVAGVEEMAREEGVKVDDVAQQALDHVLAGRPRKRPAPGEGSAG